jgi:peptidyl-prolyl cis-trans isomerase B (cyclophilin B)
MLKYICVILLIVVFSVRCSSPSGSGTSNDKKTVHKKTSLAVKAKKKKKVSQARTVALNNQNVEAELIKFGNGNKETLVLLETKFGNMKIRLYENTPLHRANFIRLAKNKFYDDTEFYRVVNNFIVQGGDNDDWERGPLKDKMGKYTIPAEFRKGNIHKKGAVSMARDYEKNPDKRSSSWDFFIVQGTVYTPGEIRGAEQTYDLDISPEHKKIYMTQGGCPHLDGQHTVFGEVVEGFDVIDKIAAVEVGQGDWPLNRVAMKIRVQE